MKDFQDQFSSSAATGCCDIVDSLIEDGIDIHQNHNLALNLAACNGHLNVVQRIVDKCMNDHIHDDNKEIFITTLSFAAQNGRLDIVKFLVSKGVNADKALSCASDMDNVDIVEFLLKEGYVDPNAINGEALKRASYAGNLDIVKILIEYGADLNAYGEDALKKAASSGEYYVVKYLFKQNVISIQKDDECLLDYMLYAAIEYSDIDFVNYICSQVNMRTMYKRNPIVKKYINYIKERVNSRI